MVLEADNREKGAMRAGGVKMTELEEELFSRLE